MRYKLKWKGKLREARRSTVDRPPPRASPSALGSPALQMRQRVLGRKQPSSPARPWASDEWHLQQRERTGLGGLRGVARALRWCITPRGVATLLCAMLLYLLAS